MSSSEAAARQFIDDHVGRIAPLQHRSNLAAWDAAVTGTEEAIRASAEARAAVKAVYSEPAGFEAVRRFLASDEVRDPLVHRQLVLLEKAFAVNQLPLTTIDDLTRREAELEEIFYNFRARFEGAELSDNHLRERLAASDDSTERRRIWEAAKSIGAEIAEPLRDLVRQRNEAARSLGFSDFYTMELQHHEVDLTALRALLEEFRERSEAAYRSVRQDLDRELARRFRVTTDELRPWHWDDFFSQDAPRSGEIDLDPYFAEPLDLEQLARDYFASIGLPVDDVLERSDLYEREGKEQHAFCTDIDREGDVRILCNLRPNERWAKTLLHELGHAVYDKYLPRSLPYLVRMPAHTLATESIAMYFGRLTRDPEWVREVLKVHLSSGEIEEVDRQQRLTMLVAARWMLVMVDFERELYANPDRPDLNSLWWDLVERHQHIHRPDGRDAPDWATKIHLSLAPVYYHNYLLGELMASQLTAAAAGSGRIGSFLRERVFDRGATLHWNELVREATGEPLSARYFVDQFVSGAAADA